MHLTQLTDCADTEAHGSSILNSQVTKTSSSTGEDNPVADLGMRVLDSTVDSNTRTEDGSGLRRVDAVGDGGDMADVGLDVLREGTVDGEARVLSLSAD